jgi:putative SOS response-associated peptidase YedK
MCNLYSITTNQAAIIALFRVINRYVGNLPPMPGVFPDYPAPVVRNNQGEREMVMMRWGIGIRSSWPDVRRRIPSPGFHTGVFRLGGQRLRRPLAGTNWPV